MQKKKKKSDWSLWPWLPLSVVVYSAAVLLGVLVILIVSSSFYVRYEKYDNPGYDGSVFLLLFVL